MLPWEINNLSNKISKRSCTGYNQFTLALCLVSRNEETEEYPVLIV